MSHQHFQCFDYSWGCYENTISDVSYGTNTRTISLILEGPFSDIKNESYLTTSAGASPLTIDISNHVSKQVLAFYSFPKRQILDSSKLIEFADDNFKFDENGRKFSKRVENPVGKGEFARSRSFFERPILRTRKNQGLFGKGLTLYCTRLNFNHFRIDIF